jgi:hypothetical protein
VKFTVVPVGGGGGVLQFIAAVKPAAVMEPSEVKRTVIQPLVPTTVPGLFVPV